MKMFSYLKGMVPLCQLRDGYVSFRHGCGTFTIIRHICGFLVFVAAARQAVTALAFTGSPLISKRRPDPT